MDGKVKSSALTSSSAEERRPGMVMLITPDRVVYAGLLGKPLIREFGSLTVYVSLGSPFMIQIGNDAWDSAELRVVPPDTPHRISTMDRLIGVILIEPESVCLDKLPRFLQPRCGLVQPAPLIDRARSAFASLLDGSVAVDSIRSRVDQFFFDETLASRTMEPRVTKVVETIKCQPCDTLGAEDFALQVDLSFSRFLHLFKAETGTTFRRFRAWKRARSFLSFVNMRRNLTDIALETGYPDSSHFSHTVRRYWGLTPKDIVAGSRQLTVSMDGNSFNSASY